MKEEKNSSYKEFAQDYDRQVREYDSYGHDVLFGMCFEFVKAGETLLDIGIGTGLASEHFAGLGLKVYGLDTSEEMLQACRSKGFTQELTRFDMTRDSIPYDAEFFHHVISCGAFHFLGDLETLFANVARVLKPGGVFAFTVAPQGQVEEDPAVSEPFLKEDTPWGVPIYKHSIPYVRELLAKKDIPVEKEQRLLIKGADKKSYDMLFSALVTRKLG